MDDTTTTAATDALGLEVISPDACWELLAGTPVGRVAFTDAGAPMVLPVMHAVVGRRIVFRSLPGGKLAAARMGWPVAFEVDGWDAATRSGWSVVAQGSAESAPEDSDLDTLDLDQWIPKVAGGTWVEVRVDEVSGRRFRSGR